VIKGLKAQRREYITKQ
jgi:hypothetical protein